MWKKYYVNIIRVNPYRDHERYHDILPSINDGKYCRFAKVIVELTVLWFSFPKRITLLEFSDAKNQKQ